jgi:hypothetical protein
VLSGVFDLGLAEVVQAHAEALVPPT